MPALALKLPVPSGDRLTLDALSTAVLLFDGALHLVDMNTAAEALLEASLKQVQGLPAATLLGEAAADGGLIARARALASPLTEHELQMRLPGDRPLTVDCTVSPVPEAGVPPPLVVELHSLERHRRVSNEERLLSLNEAARALVRGLAHEIRNPLGGLRGAAQLLERELHAEALREYTRVIISEADRLQKLLDRLLGPRRPPAIRVLSVHEVTERVYALLRAEAPAGCVITRDYDPSLPAIRADPELLVQAVLNVARNAVQAAPGGGAVVEVLLRTRIHRHVTIGSRRHRQVVRIDVHDNGPGVPAALRESLFYPMVTGRPEGSGLGLSIAQSLVAQQGGLIEFHSLPGDTTFSILLPVEDTA